MQDGVTEQKAWDWAIGWMDEATAIMKEADDEWLSVLEKTMRLQGKTTDNKKVLDQLLLLRKKLHTAITDYAGGEDVGKDDVKYGDDPRYLFA